MRMRFLLLIVLSFYSLCASSQLVSRVTGLEEETLSSYWGYLFDVSLAKEGDLSNVANPCYQTGCAIGLGIGNSSGLAITGFLRGNSYECSESSATIEDLLKCLDGEPLKKETSNPNVIIPSTFSLPLSATVFSRARQEDGQQCVGLIYGNGYDVNWGVYNFIPGMLCSGGLPVPDTYCKLPSAINLDHGLVSSEDVNNSTITKTMSINCSSDISLSIGVQGSSDGTLPLGGEDVISTIYIDNVKMKDNGITKDFKSGINTISIKSVLSTKVKLAAGKYVGQGVLVLSFP